MDKQKFLEWYFSGSDQMQLAILIDLGKRVQESLTSGEDSVITTEELMKEHIDFYSEYRRRVDFLEDAD